MYAYKIDIVVVFFCLPITPIHAHYTIILHIYKIDDFIRLTILKWFFVYFMAIQDLKYVDILPLLIIFKITYG